MRLTRLGASSVEMGEPYLDERAEVDPISRARAALKSRVQQVKHSLPEQPGANVTLSATWDIGSLSADQTLLLVDQLRFDAAVDAEIKPSNPSTSEWQDPEAKLTAMLASLSTPPPADLSPQFLFIARPTDEQLLVATTDAYNSATKIASRLAKATGRVLGELTSINHTQSLAEGRADRILERQRCLALIESSTFTLLEGDVASEDARMIDIKVTVHTNFKLE